MIFFTAGVITLAIVPAMENFSGGLMSFGPNLADLFRRSASHIARLLRGENPAEMPIEQPTQFDLVINLKTVKALGLIAPPALLARADEVIE